MKNNQVETRNLDVTFNAEADYKLVGYVNKYGTESHPIRDKRSGELFLERIERGAFTRSINDTSNDIYADYNHDQGQVLGRQSEGTLKLVEDEIGLRAEIQLNPDDPQHVSVYQKVKRRDVKGMSFKFLQQSKSDKRLSARLVSRSVTQAMLISVSPVVKPAYETSEVEARDVDNMENVTIKDALEVINNLSEQDRAEVLKNFQPTEEREESVAVEVEKEKPAETEGKEKQVSDYSDSDETPVEKTDEEKKIEEDVDNYSKKLLDKLKELIDADTPAD
jgi:HK97 family phage prohead protease